MNKSMIQMTDAKVRRRLRQSGGSGLECVVNSINLILLFYH